MIIGVLALQGDFREHIQAIAACGHEALEVRRVSELDHMSGFDSSRGRINNNRTTG